MPNRMDSVMVWTFSPVPMITSFLAALLLSGCADKGQVRPQTQGPVAPVPPSAQEKKSEVAVESPPQPAPALFIPGSPQPAFLVSQPNLVETLPIAVNFQETAQVIPLPVQTPGQVPIVNAQGQPGALSKPAAASPLREIAAKSAQRYATMDTYIMRLRRREHVGNQKRPEEILLCKFRKEPWSVYFKWLGPEAKNREVVYVKGRYENVIHTLTAAGDILFVPAGKHIKVAPDSVLVKSKSRYPITEAGVGTLIERFGRMVEAAEKGDQREGAVKYMGQIKRPEFDNNLETVLQVLPPRTDSTLPRGGQRYWFFDTTLFLPVLIITQDDTGREVEYYCHDRFLLNVKLDEDDFNPDRLWKNPSQ
jgi:hypothetical protein